ncbi:hypothetical protein [Holophaga foetida]|uniref:hypothetical protein n=1 Tax=Holophaga foetida TaxID=35839 RepID=UPI0006963CA0|nr:hypothetical protein [Holophaga foetida]
MLDSPNGQFHANLTFAGEIRFGPIYYTLNINGRELAKRIFGDPLLWSPDSKLLAAQEWLTTEYGAGPITRAVLIDPTTWRIATLKVAEKGFAESFQFSGSTFIYRKVFTARGERIELEVDLNSIHNWVNIEPITK